MAGSDGGPWMLAPKRRGRVNRLSGSDSLLSRPEDRFESDAAFIKQVKSHSESLRSLTTWPPHVVSIEAGLNIPGKRKRLVCLALGSPSRDKDALYQVGYLYAIAQDIEFDDIIVSDPILTETDVERLRKIKVCAVAAASVLLTDTVVFSEYDWEKLLPTECHQDAADWSVLIFAPHCPRAITRAASQCLLKMKSRMMWFGNQIDFSESELQSTLQTREDDPLKLQNHSQMYNAFHGLCLIRLVSR